MRDINEIEQTIKAEHESTPWFTFPALEFLLQFDLSEKTVLEYGSGGSTIYWAKNAKFVSSMENNAKFYNEFKQKISSFGNVSYKLATDQNTYVGGYGIWDSGMFDIIVDDGSWRYQCAEEAIKRLKKGGMIILDNSDWCRKTVKLFRDANLIQIDFHGWGVFNPYSWTTSFFLDRDFNFPYKGDYPAFSKKAWRREDFVGEMGVTD